MSTDIHENFFFSYICTILLTQEPETQKCDWNTQILCKWNLCMIKGREPMCNKTHVQQIHRTYI